MTRGFRGGAVAAAILCACGGTQQTGGNPAASASAACPATSLADRSCTLAGRPGLLVCSGGAVLCATTVVSLTFDDALSEQLAAAGLLEKHGMRGTFFLNTWRLQQSSPANMTAAQARDLQDHGHEIGGHTLNHPHLTTLSSDQQHVEICNDRANLMSLGMDVQNFAYPFGDWDSAARQAVIDCRYNSARDISGVTVTNPAESFAPKDPFVLRAPGSIQRTDTVANIEGMISRAEARGGWLLLTFHHLCDGCDVNAITAPNLDALLGWLEQRSTQGTVVARVRDVIGGTTQPAVTWQ